MSKFQHDVMLRIVKILNVLMIELPFAACWFLYYSHQTYANLAWEGHFAILGLFFILYIVLGKIYDAFWMSMQRVSELVYGQILGAMATDGILYIVICLMSAKLCNLLPGIAAIAGQLVMAAIWASCAHKWYYKTFPPQKTAVVYDVRHGMEKLINEYGLSQKYDVQVTLSVSECLADLSILDGMETVFVSGVHSHERNIILKHCVGKGIITIEPRPTHVFLSVPQYNRIFVQIHKWFQFGIYDFTKENFMLSFIKISSLFEGYLLLKMIEYFQSRGYVLESTGKCVYPTRRNWKYKNTKCVNTFLFENDRYKLTLYYQPVIYDTNESRINGIHLIRNNSIPVINGDGDDNRSGGHYYTPDYLIKMEGDSSTRYLILDAKFSDLACVRRYHVRDLAFKYLFSISPVQPADTVVGLCIIYGKCKSSDQIQSAYDKQLQNQKITPITELLPLMESIANDNHYNNLDVLMRKAFISE